MAAQTVFDLGALVKSKYPGSYDDLADDELGRKVKAKFPGSYDDFSDAPAPAARPLLPPSPLANVQRPPADPELVAPPSPDEPTPAAMVAPPGLPRSLGGGDLPPAQATPFNLPPKPVKKPVAPSGPIGPLPQVSGPTESAPATLQNAPPPATPITFPAMPIDATTGKPKVLSQPPTQVPEVPGAASAARRAAESAGGPGPTSTPVIPPEQATTPEWKLAAKAFLNTPKSVQDLGIPPPKTAAEGLQQGLLNVSLGLIDPQNIAITLASGGVAHALSGIVNTPMGVELISKLPGNPELVRKAVDLAAKMAVPAAFTGQNLYQGGKALPGIMDAATPAERAARATEAATNLLIGAAGLYGMHQGLQAASELHPPAPETVPEAYPGAPTQVPAPEVRAAAPEVAATLEKAGQRLAAKSWRELGDWGATSTKPFQVQAGDQTITFEPVGKGYVKATNQNGDVIRAASGSIEQAKTWLDQNVVRTKPNPEGGGAISMGSGAVESADIQQVAVAGQPAKSLYDRAIEIADSQPSFGMSSIRRQLGLKFSDANALLGRLVDEGIIKQAKNANGATVYHRISQPPPSAEPAETTAPAISPPITPGPAPAPEAGQESPAPVPPSAEPSKQATSNGPASVPAPANDLDTILGGKDTADLTIGGVPHTLQRTVIQGKNGERKEYRVLDSEGQVVAGVRQATVENWLKKQAAKQEKAATPVEKPSTPVETPAATAPEPEKAPLAARSPEGIETQAPVTQATPGPKEVIAERPSESDIVAPPAIEEPHKFSSTQVQLPEKFAARARDAAAAIPDHELAEDGRESDFHITAKYGLHDEEPSAVKQALANEPPITATIGKVSIFPAKETDVQRGGDQYDVVKLDVDSPDLHRINKKIADAAPHTDTHPVYQPHITLAYVKPGEGKKYVGKSVPGLTGQQVTFPAVRFSGKDHSTTDIPLTGKPVTPQVTEPGTKYVLPSVASSPGQRAQTAKPGLDRFMEVYEKNLRTVVQKHPGEYAFSAEEVPNVAAKMRAAIEKGTASLKGRAFSFTTRELGIRPTEKAIKEFIAKAPEVAPVDNAAPVATEASDEDVQTGSDKLIRQVANRLKGGESLGDNVSFQNMAREAYGDKEISPRDKYDALEAGVNSYLSRESQKFTGVPEPEAFRRLHEVESKVPTQTHRTAEQIGEQQFSTPPSLSFLASKLLAPKEGESVLEPSAGTGSLAIWPRAAGAKVHTNELAPRRAGILKTLGFPVTSEDARYINDTLPDHVKPTAVLMNPPFSSDTRSGDHDTNVGIDHVEQALGRLAPGGRLVAILGTKQGNPNSPKLWKRWQKIANKHNIRAAVEIDGSAYRKYGTSFGNSVVVIDKTGPTPGANWAEKVQNIQQGTYKTPEEAWDATQHIARDRTGPEASAREPESGAGLEGNSERGSGSQPEPARGLGKRSVPGEQRRPGTGSGVPSESKPSESAPSVPRSEPANRPAEGQQPGQLDAGNGSAVDSGRVLETPPAPPASKEPARERSEEQGGSFLTYIPQQIPPDWGAVRHQANIVETASMAAIDPPAITVRPNIDWNLVKNGDLSEVQLEAIAYAIQAHNLNLSTGERIGFFVGDGTGVGKGREIAGTILHYWNSGVRRIIWVSYSTDLKEDAERDMRDLKANIPVRLINDFKRASDINMGDGVVFLTYNSLSSGTVAAEAGNATAKPKEFLRLNQLQKWAGEDPVIVFDEAHKAKNSTEEKGSRGRQAASQSGLAVVDLQKRIPKGRVIYSSATGATDVRNLGYATRLGMWGIGTSFDTFENFRNSIAAGGVGAMEVVARDLKSQGRYLSRFISFEGVDYREVTHKLTPEQTALYDTAAEAWQTVFKNFEQALNTTEAKGRARAGAMSAFWSSNQRFFRQFVTSLKIPSLIKEVAQARNNDKSVVISLMGTGAAQADREVARIQDEEGSLDDIDFSPADTILRLVERSFPTARYVEVEDEHGNKRSEMLLDADGRPVQSKEALELKEALLQKLQGLRFPEHPIDQIISRFGSENVAELTGRKNQFITDPETGKKEIRRRKKEGVPIDKTNISEAQDFQAGKKHIAIISAAASTGISLHSDRRAANQERRVHVVLETKWSADTQMQDFGRTHRTNEVTPPEYVLLSTDVGGEKRFLSTIARRLAQLGALTRGQRDAASSGDLSKYNFESDYGAAATQAVLSNLERLREVSLGFDGDQALVDMGLKKDLTKPADTTGVDVPNFLNRIMGLEPKRQNKIFEMFIEHFERAIQSAKENGTFDEGVADIKSPSIALTEPARMVKEQEGTGAKTFYYPLKVAFKPSKLTFEKAKATGAAMGFYRNKRSGKIWGVNPATAETDTDTGSMKARVYLSNVHSADVRMIRESELDEGFEKVPDATAKDWWDDEVSKIPDLDYRGLHVIGGSILPVWNVLQGSSNRLRTVRLKTDAGQYIIGAEIPSDAINRVLRGLGTADDVNLSPEDVQKMVMEDGHTVDLAGDMKLRSVRLLGEKRMEVLQVPWGQERTVQSFGVSKEYIQHRQRYFVNLFDEGALGRLLKQYPPVGSSTGAQEFTKPNRFGSEAGALNLGAFLPSSWTQPAGPPVKKAQIRKIRKATREADLPDASLNRILKSEFGVKALDKLNQTQASELIGKLSEKLPTGVLAREPGSTDLAKMIASPSVILTRSRAGTVIWRAASREYWRQKSIVDRFSRNYHKAIAGMGKDDKERIKLFRYVKQLLAVEDGGKERAEMLLSAAGEDPAAVDTIDTDFLTPEQKQANDRLTQWVFNPMWQRAVSEGLVPEDRYIDDYLTFYRSDLLQGKPRSRRDMAALLAAEEGMPLAVADKILAMANAKRTTFGPFDFKRGKWSLPGTLPLDEVADIYIRGFARKSAHTAFLSVANRMRSKISNPHLREYARMYINQYVGVPLHSSFDDWISKKANSEGLLKKAFGLVGKEPPTAEQIAMAATSLQYVSKIGLNLFTPIQNLTQIANTAAKAGAYRTAQGALTYTMARSLPNSMNPLIREKIRLQQSGVLDSLSNKVERPHVNGLKGRALEAMTFFFNQSEQMNRGASFYAGYFAAKAAGKSESEAMDDGRDLVRVTQFFSGRLDAPLLSRMPVGRVFYQFKVFSLKTWETFWHQMNHVDRLRWLFYSAAIGGPAALGIASLMHTFMPDSPYTEALDGFQETFNLAAFLQVPRLAKAVGIWQFPAAEEATSEYRKWWENMARFVAGPTISGIADTFNSALQVSTADEGDREEKAWKLTWMLMRSWVPGGVSLRRLGQAMRDGGNTEAQLRMIFAAYDKDNPKDDGVIQKISESLGVEKLLPDLPETVEVY